MAGLCVPALGGEANHRDPCLWALGTNKPLLRISVYFWLTCDTCHSCRPSSALSPCKSSVTVQGGSVWSLTDVCACGGSRGQQVIWDFGKRCVGEALHLIKCFCCCRSAGLRIPLLNALIAGLNSSRKGKWLLNWRDSVFFRTNAPREP